MGLCFSAPSKNRSTTTTRTPATVFSTGTTGTIAERSREAQNKAKAAQERRDKFYPVNTPLQGFDLSMRREYTGSSGSPGFNYPD